MGIPPSLKWILWTSATFGVSYVLAIFSLLNPTVQRNATYAHNVNPTRWQNLSNVEQFGFLEHQIQPFTVTTPDNIVLFAWHILPVQAYLQHADSLKKQEDLGVKSFEVAARTGGLQLLLQDPAANVIVSFHGNAGHLASSHRPPTYQNFLATSSPDRPVHVITFDYRGFGLSTGTPSERGVIQDAITLLSAVTGLESTPSAESGSENKIGVSHEFKGIHPSRVLLVGQSLGTFVSTAFYHEWTLVRRLPAFKSLVLIASFTSLTRLLDSYSIKGITPPLLSPLVVYPRLQQWVLSKIADQWDTKTRLLDLFKEKEIELDLTIMHAQDDREIPWEEGRRNWDAILNLVDAKTEASHNVESEQWQSSDFRKSARWRSLRHGGHNRIPTSEQAKLAILEVLNQS